MTTTTNRNNSEDDLRDLNKIDADITKHRKYAIRLIMTVFTLFIIYFVFKVFIDISLDSKGTWVGPQLSKLSTVESGNWGTFGDFIGGILNPIFALFAFYWLTYSVRLQIKELKDTRQELKKAATAQAETATHQEKIANLEEKNVDTQKEILELQKQTLEKQIKSSEAQQLQISIQNFENLFFELLKTKSDATNQVLYKHESFNVENRYTLQGKDAIKTHINNFKLYYSSIDWSSYYKDELLDIFGSYFRICYQIVKLIENNMILKNLEKEYKKEYSIKQKEYFDIFRSTLTQHELELIFFNCLSEYGNKKFKRLIEKYGIFEPLLIDNITLNENNYAFHSLTKYAYKYKNSVFEENELWNIYIREINDLKTNLDKNKINGIINLMKSLKIYRSYLNSNMALYNIKDEKSFINEINNEIEYLQKKPSTSESLNILINIIQEDLTHTIYLILKYNIDYDEFCKFMESKRPGNSSIE